MGRVHEAWDPLLRRKVALKLLHRGDPVQLLRFMREAQIQARVEHPQICKVFEVGSEGDQPYIAMQFISGKTLGEAREELDLRNTARIMAEVAGAIHGAHRQGLVHRDLKPSNILLEPQEDGSLKPFVLDFGLAKDQSVADQTLSWGFVGTPAFMSPEQARGDDPSAASDVYGLGATFYACCSGHPPYEATTLVGLAAQQTEHLVLPLRRTDPKFPKDLDTILLKCLDPEPAKRYGTAFQVEEDLRRWLAGEPILARRVGAPERVWRKVKRHKALSIAVAAGLLAAASLLVWNIVAGRRAQLQVELAQRFGLEVREVEQLLRIERMLPPHDLRPALERVRARMVDIRGHMARLGSASEGPGRYALARGFMALRDFESARGELEQAWHAGYRPPEVAYALGSVLTEQFAREDWRVGKAGPEKVKGFQALLTTRFVAPALAYFQQARGQTQEDPAYGEAQVDFLKHDFLECINKCKKAFLARPWMYEAKLLEARAWLQRANGAPDFRPHPEVVSAGLAEAGKALDEALRLAPSDEGIYRVELARIYEMSILQADSGRPSEHIFRRADDLFQKAMAIRPDDLGLKEHWLTVRMRQGLDLLRRGLDARPLMDETLDFIRPDQGALRETQNGDRIALLHWVLAEAYWRRGQDPLPELQEARHWFLPDSNLRIQPACLEAEVLMDRGKDSSALLDECDRILAAQAKAGLRGAYQEILFTYVCLARAKLLWGKGGEPIPFLDQALAHLERSRRIEPTAIYAYFFLTEVHSFRAMRKLALGEDPEPELAKAVRIGEAGLRVMDGHYRPFLALAAARHLEAQWRLRQGRDPQPSLDRARTSLARCLKLCPTDPRIHLMAARVELAAARDALRKGTSPSGPLERSEAAARKGLAFKADCPHLWLALARIRRVAAEWAAHLGRPGPEAAEGLGFAQKALLIHPGWQEGKAEVAVLEGLRDPAHPNPPQALSALLERNRFLGWEYSSYLVPADGPTPDSADPTCAGAARRGGVKGAFRYSILVDVS
jgi:serine/threonine-protein kinase